MLGREARIELERIGGLGDDSFIAKVKGAAASDGIGDDVLRSTTSKSTLLNGGPGNDTFYGGAGKTLINAKDGQRGDVVYCGSKKNVVLADKGDTIVGPCTLEG